MSRRHIVALDVDSVMFPINELVVLPAIARHLGYEVRKGEITDWHYGEIPDGMRVAMAQFARHDLYDKYGPADFPVLTKALVMLRYGYEVIAVSTAHPNHMRSKADFLQRLGFSQSETVFTGDKSLVNFGVLVDDNPATCERMPTSTIVYDQPWNKHVEGIPRVYGMYDLPYFVKEVLG